MSNQTSSTKFFKKTAKFSANREVRMMMPVKVEVLVTLLLCASLSVDAVLRVGFYDFTCPQAESIVRSVIAEAVQADVGIAADFVRMHFHDCFVRGCDASILLDSTPNNTAEKDSPINNPSLEGFDVIDKAKSQVEAACPGVVSCADIITFAARDGIDLVGGPFYEVPAGRRDGKVSLASETFANLPNPAEGLDVQTKLFAGKGLSQTEMVTLSGAHTIGIAHCNVFENRLYNFSDTVKQDPSLDPDFAEIVKQTCPGGSNDAAIEASLDLVTPDTFDNNYYKNVLNHRVLFTSDQTLLSTWKTARQVTRYAYSQALFNRDFTAAMVKLGKTGVLTGKRGEVRLDCKVVNEPKQNLVDAADSTGSGRMSQ